MAVRVGSALPIGYDPAGMERLVEVRFSGTGADWTESFTSSLQGVGLYKPVKSLFIDNFGNAFKFALKSIGTGQTLRVPSGVQAYFPLWGSPMMFQYEAVGGDTGAVSVYFSTLEAQALMWTP